MDNLEKENISWFPIVSQDAGELDQRIDDISTKLRVIKDLVEQRHLELSHAGS